MVPNPIGLDDLVEGVEDEAGEGTELDRLAAAARISEELRSLGDELMEKYVKSARDAGASWSQIGEKLQVTKQAAQQRFVSVSEEAVKLPAGLVQKIKGIGLKGGMFDRFTNRARQALVSAREAALGFKHNYIGTEHILIGLTLDSESIAGKALAELKITPESLRSQVTDIIGLGRNKLHPASKPPFTPRSRKVLELSFKEALQLGHNYIGTEHILLGLITEGEGVGAQILTKSGVTYDAAKHVVVNLLSRLPDPGS